MEYVQKNLMMHTARFCCSYSPVA